MVAPVAARAAAALAARAAARAAALAAAALAAASNAVAELQHCAGRGSRGLDQFRMYGVACERLPVSRLPGLDVGYTTGSLRLQQGDW